MSREVRPWPARLLVREAVATAMSGRWTSLLVVCAIAWTCAVVGAADALAVTRSVQAERAWVAAGAYVLRVQGSVRGEEQLPVPAGACESLERSEGVVDAFWATRRAEASSFSHIPVGRFSVVQTSPGMWAFLGVPVPSTPSALLSDGLARRTGIVGGAPVRVGGSDLLRVQVASVAVLGDDYDGALLVPGVPASTADMCFVRTDAAHVGAVTELAATTLGWQGRDAVVSPRLYDGEFTVDFSTAHEGRDLRWAWAPAGLVLALLWALVQWFRRSQSAIYTTFGVGAPGRVVLQTGEWVALAAAGLAWGWSIGVVGAMALGAEPRLALMQVTVQAVPAVLAATGLAVLLSLRPTGSLLDQLKDR